MNSSHNKWYLISIFIVIIIIFIIVIIIKSITQTQTQQTIPSPTPNRASTPTLIPLRFTGGDISQDLPPDVKVFSQQKTELRRKTPLQFSFGDISFDYREDAFILALKEPKDVSQIAFNAWLEQTYPAIPVDQFSIIN